MTTRTLSHSTYKVAEAPASEVATSESSALPELPRRMPLLSLGTFWRSLVAWITATVHAAGALRDRVAAWLREVSGEVVIEAHAQCSDCGRPCALVNADVPTAAGCAGPLFVGFCDVCLDYLETTPETKCPKSPYHRITNARRMAASEFHARGKPTAEVEPRG